MRSAVRRIPAIMIIFLIAGVILMPVSTPRWSALAAEPIKLGEVGPLSPPGDYANGALMKNAAEIATDEINAAGGVLGRQVTVSYQDSRGMPEEGTAVAERLVSQEHVSAIFGEYHSSVFLAEMEVAHKNNVPIVAVDVWALKITGKGYPEVFRVAPNQALIASKYGDWLAAAGFKNIAILYEKTDGGQSHLDVLLPALDKHGIKYDAVGVDPNQTDFTPQIVRFKNHTPPYDFFASVYSEAGAYNMISQAFAQGFAPTGQTGIYNSGGPATDPTFWKTLREAGKYVVTENPALPKSGWNDKTRGFVAAFRARFKVPPSPQAMESYDAEWILADAIKRAGSTDPKALIAAMETSTWLGTRGKYSFSLGHSPDWAYHQFMEAPVALIQYDNVDQAFEDAPVLWPRNIASVQYLYLKPPVVK